MNDQFGIDLERERLLAHLSRRAETELRGHGITHRAVQALFEHFFQLACRFRLGVAAAHRVDAVEVLRDVGPVLVERLIRSDLGRGDHVAARRAKKLPLAAK